MADDAGDPREGAGRVRKRRSLRRTRVRRGASTSRGVPQLKEKRHADKYRGSEHPVYLIAVEFSQDARNVVAFEVEWA